jgi:DNA polymerase V
MSNCAGSEPFALQVLGDSMAPEFPDGCVVVSEPGSAVHDGCYVIADYKGEIILRQLRLTAGTSNPSILNTHTSR